jgi:plastocyanin
MRHLKVGLAVVVFTLIIGSVLQAQLTETKTPGQVRTFQITAQNYSFSPFNIIVNQGEKVRFVITAGDRDYEFRLKDYDIKEKIQQGVPATIDFTATKAGTFTFNSPGMVHRTMKGTLVVKGLSEKKKKK